MNKLPTFLSGCLALVAWFCLMPLFYALLGWAFTEHYPQDNPVPRFFIVPVQNAAGQLDFRAPNALLDGDTPAKPPIASGNYALTEIAPNTFEAQTEIAMGMATLRYQIDGKCVIPLSFVHADVRVWGGAIVGASFAAWLLYSVLMGRFAARKSVK